MISEVLYYTRLIPSCYGSMRIEVPQTHIIYYYMDLKFEFIRLIDLYVVSYRVTMSL